MSALSKVSENVILIANSSKEFVNLPFPVFDDIIPGLGPMGGVYTGLKVSGTYYNLIVACDMPFIQPSLLEFLMSQSKGYDLVIPKAPDGYHPLCAVYSKGCIEPIEVLIKAGDLKLTHIFPFVKVREIELSAPTSYYDPDMLFNINTEEDYLKAISIAEIYHSHKG